MNQSAMRAHGRYQWGNPLREAPLLRRGVSADELRRTASVLTDHITSALCGCVCPHLWSAPSVIGAEGLLVEPPSELGRCRCRRPCSFLQLVIRQQHNKSSLKIQLDSSTNRRDRDIVVNPFSGCVDAACPHLSSCWGLAQHPFAPEDLARDAEV